MKTIRLLFNDQMARAIVEGRKTVTRRPAMGLHGCAVNPALDLGGVAASTGIAFFDMFGRTHEYARTPCAPGDLLIGRECWRPVMESWRSFVEYRAGGELDVDGRALFVAERGIALRFPGAKKDVHTEKWHPSNHMPDWAARIRRRVLSVTVERLQDITEGDAVLEGPEPAPGSGSRFLSPLRSHQNATREVHNARQAFRLMWDDIYAAKGLGWFNNPWAWRIEFSAENVEATP